MANASTTQTSSASDTTGTPIPLAYGYQWVTGKRTHYYMLQDTGNSWEDFTRVGRWALGHGEWDGPIELWINDVLAWNGGSTPASPPFGFSGQNWITATDAGPAMVFNFHRGADSIIGSGLIPSSSGPDQGVDILFEQFPTAINPLAFSRIAYYMIMRKQPIENQTNNHRNDPTQWTDIAPIGLWKSLRCRLFDDEGNMTGYAFTTNPAWHFVDLLLRRKIYPDYRLDLNGGPDDLTDAIRNRFDWGSIFTSAQYFDQFLTNGRRRFTGNYAFSQQTTLQACLEQILLCCRSFMREYGGKIGLVCDMPRASVFTFSRNLGHILPGSWEANDQTLHTTANRFIANFRDLLVPQASVIASITCPDHGQPTVTTEEPHPFNNGDFIAIGGTDTVYDGQWQVDQVPVVIDPTQATDPVTFTMIAKGSNYPTSVGSGGGIGLLYSRFKERAPEFWHKTNMLARGMVGLGIPRLRNKVKQSLDYATTTWDQASRLTTYERDRLLGVDQTPYITPPVVKFRTSLFARDAFGNLAAAIQPGDHVTLDDTVNFQYAGEFEVLDPLTIYPPACAVSASGGELERAVQDNSGEIEFALGPYNEAIMYDTSDPSQAGWPSVPGSDPGNDSNFTGIALASGGTFVFFTGALPSGQSFNLPSTGFTPTNLLDWASPQGYLEKGHPMHVIALCDASAERQLALNYVDGSGNTWNGDTNFAALAWLSADVTTTSNGLTWIEFTLLGGEKIIFGQGVVADGTTLVLPSPYSTAKLFAIAFPHDAPLNDNDAHGVAAFVDSSQVVHLNYEDGDGNIWHGNASVLAFAWQNNMGTVVTETDSGASWMYCPLSDGTVFGAGCALGLTNGANFALPAAAGDGSTLEAMIGPSGFDIVSHPAHGVGACLLDGSNDVVIKFEDGEGNTWFGTADVFGIFCTPSSGAPTQVIVSPASASLAAGSTLQFTATVSFNTDHAVTWSVDGIAGGNVTVGTVDSTGLYSAPNTAGTHTITATSVADPTASGSAVVTVWGTIVAPGSVLTTVDGDIIYSNGDVIYVL